MSKPTTIDYTTKRAGSYSGRGRSKIERCPACGRKGVIHRRPKSSLNTYGHWFCDHVTTVTVQGGFNFVTVLDGCSGRIADDGTLLAATPQG